MTRLESINAMVVKLGGEGTATDELAAWQAFKNQMDAIVAVLNSISGGEETLYQNALNDVVVAQGGTGGGDILELCNELAVLLGASTAVDVLGALNNIITELSGTVQTDILAAHEEVGRLIAEPAIDWDYVGTMTVGEISEPAALRGFSDGDFLPACGSLPGFSGFILYGDGGEELGPGFAASLNIGGVYYYIDLLEVNGQLFENGISVEGTFFAQETDILPSTGQTCSVKVKKEDAIE